LPWHIVFDVIKTSKFVFWLWFLVAVDLLPTLIGFYFLVETYHFSAADTGCITTENAWYKVWLHYTEYACYKV